MNNMQFSNLRNMLDKYSEVQLRLILYRTYSHKPRPPFGTTRFISIKYAEQWLVEKGYNPQFYTVYGKDPFDWLSGCRIYYGYHDKKYFDKYLNLMSRLKDISQEEASQLHECIEHIWMIAITQKREIYLI